MAAACSRAQMLAKQGDRNAVHIADLFCREARLRIADSFRNLYGKNDGALYKTAQRVMAGEYAWLERGTIGLPEWPPQSGGTPEPGPLREQEAAAGVG
jgi:hypothetical protein